MVGGVLTAARISCAGGHDHAGHRGTAEIEAESVAYSLMWTDRG
jgi:hypothetical protein